MVPGSYIIVLSLNAAGTKQCFVVLRDLERAALAEHLSLLRENIASHEQSNCGLRQNVFLGTENEYSVLWLCS